MLLAAIGRACRPTSKMGWHDWAATTSLEISLSQSLTKLDSQHFWDQMDVVSDEALENIESEIVKSIVDKSGPIQYSMNKMMEDLKTIRLTSFIEQKDGKGIPKTDYKLEKIKLELQPIADLLAIDPKKIKI